MSELCRVIPMCVSGGVAACSGPQDMYRYVICESVGEAPRAGPEDM